MEIYKKRNSISIDFVRLLK